MNTAEAIQILERVQLGYHRKLARGPRRHLSREESAEFCARLSGKYEAVEIALRALRAVDAALLRNVEHARRSA